MSENLEQVEEQIEKISEMLMKKVEEDKKYWTKRKKQIIEIAAKYLEMSEEEFMKQVKKWIEEKVKKENA